MRLYIGLMELRVLQEREEILMNSCELSTLDSFVLNKLDISVFSEERNYWLLRTQGGTYFDRKDRSVEAKNLNQPLKISFLFTRHLLTRLKSR